MYLSHVLSSWVLLQIKLKSLLSPSTTQKNTTLGLPGFLPRGGLVLGNNDTLPWNVNYALWPPVSTLGSSEDCKVAGAGGGGL